MAQEKPTPTRKVIRGDTDDFVVRFNDITKNNLGQTIKTPIDITGWDIKFTVRESVPSTDIEDDTDAIISKTALISDGTNGEALFNVTRNDTDIDAGDYWYDIQYTADGVTKSLSKAKYVVTSDVTRSIG